MYGKLKDALRERQFPAVGFERVGGVEEVV